jgi:aminoglycoside 6'-N-acetyltransferase I
MDEVHIVDLTEAMAAEIEQAARILQVVFAPIGAWVDLEEARQEVREMLAPDRILCAALEGAALAGWIGGISQYDGNVWELHPLVVRPDRQRQGIGARLVRHFEGEVQRRGGLTIVLGTDDHDGLTSLSGVDLYQDPWEHIRTIRNLADHPFTFYQKLGYTITGVVPDANGRGKPDITMAKRVG